MKAKKFQKIYFNTIVVPTDRKIINLARKPKLSDTFGEIVWATSLPVDKAMEFVKKEE